MISNAGIQVRPEAQTHTVTGALRNSSSRTAISSLLLAVIPAVYLTSMILLEDNNTIPEIPTPSLNDLGALKNPQRREEDSTAVSVIVRRLCCHFYCQSTVSDIVLDDRVRYRETRGVPVDEPQVTFTFWDFGYPLGPFLAVRISLPVTTT